MSQEAAMSQQQVIGNEKPGIRSRMGIKKARVEKRAKMVETLKELKGTGLTSITKVLKYVESKGCVGGRRILRQALRQGAGSKLVKRWVNL